MELLDWLGSIDLGGRSGASVVFIGIAKLVPALVLGNSFLLILNQSVVGPDIPGYGKPNRLSCGTKLW